MITLLVFSIAACFDPHDRPGDLYAGTVLIDCFLIMAGCSIGVEAINAN